MSANQARLARRRYLWLRVLAGIAVGAAVIVALILAWLKWHETELVFATALSRSRPQYPLPASVERITLRSADGSPIAGLVFHPDASEDSGYWVLHLHGNADTAFSQSQVRHCELLALAHFTVLSLDYRGFGASPGVATEASIDEDAESAYRELRGRGIAAERIVIWGHSLGSGPATQLAARHEAAALVLFGAFTSIPDAAADTYPYLPVRWLVGIHFDSLKLLPSIHTPVVIAHSVGDTLIPFHHGQRLYAAAREPKHLLALKAVAADGFGGHIDALYDHLDQLIPMLGIHPAAHN